MVCRDCAHDIEAFLYDYIIEQMDEGNEIYASELLDGFYDYISDKKWFDFLKARLFALSDSEDSESLLLGLLEQQERISRPRPVL
jgi:nucleoid-associated protein YejK